MKDYLAALTRAAPTPAHGRNVAREYLQARILEALQRAGAFAQYLCLPATNVVPLDDSLPEDVVAFFDAYGNATHTALQFDVVRSRLENEYGVLTDIEHLPYSLARWVHGPEETIARLPMRNDVVLTHDRDGSDVALFSTPFYLRYVTEHYPGLRFESQS